MRSADSASAGMGLAAIVVAFLAMMLAMWSFSHERIVWGCYNLAIVMVAFGVLVAVRGRRGET